MDEEHKSHNGLPMQEWFRSRDQWKGDPAIIVLDHSVHQYTLDEIAERLQPHLRKTVHMVTVLPDLYEGLVGVLTEKDGSYFVHRFGLNTVIDVSQKLTNEARENKAIYTLIEVDSTDEWRHYWEQYYGVPIEE